MEKKMTFVSFARKMRDLRQQGKKVNGVIVYKESNWKAAYSIESRSYVVNNMDNYFDDHKISKALWGTSLDESDKDVRLDYYKWEVEYCYILNE